jgi:hypothetical protein
LRPRRRGNFPPARARRREPTLAPILPDRLDARFVGALLLPSLWLIRSLAAADAAPVFVAIYQSARDPLSSGRLRARLRLASRAYAGLFFAVMLAHWIAELFGR